MKYYDLGLGLLTQTFFCCTTINLSWGGLCLCAGGPSVWCGGGAGAEGGTLAGAGGRAAEYGRLFRTGAGAGEGAAQQGGTVATEAS